jgi:hypothetical protein
VDEELLECLPHLCEPQKPPQLSQFGQCGLGSAAPIKQGVDLVHESAQHAQLRQIMGEAPQDLAFGFVQGPLDEQIPMCEQTSTLRFQPLFGAGRLLCR